MSEKLNNEKENTGEAGQGGSDSSQPSCGTSCECKTEKRLSNRTKAIISLVIILAAGAVLTRTIVLKTNTSANDNNQAFVTALPQEKEKDASAVDIFKDKNNTTGSNETSPVTTTSKSDKAKSKTSELPATERSVWKEPLNSLSSLNTVAANNDAVIVLVSERGMQKTDPEVTVIDAAAKTITSRGVNIAAFSLMKEAPEFSDLSKQLSGSGVLVMVKGRGMGGVPSTELTEEKIIQAYVTASQPRSGCGPSSCGPAECK